MAFIGKQPGKAAITSTDITDGIITADKLASNAVTTAKINADAVTDAKIADDVVGTEHLTAGEVDTTALGADAVTAAKIADDAISDEHLDPTAITGQTAETSAADDDLILLSDTSASAALKKMTRSNFLSGVGGTMTPAFYAELSATQSTSDASDTKIQFNTEIFDTDSAYDNSTNYRFTVPSGKGGKYFVFTGLSVYGSVAYSVYDSYLKIYKNGSQFLSEQHYEHDSTPNGSASFHIGRVMNLSVGDYLEVYNYCDVNGGEPRVQGGTGNSNNTYFGAYKIIE